MQTVKFPLWLSLFVKRPSSSSSRKPWWCTCATTPLRIASERRLVVHWSYFRPNRLRCILWCPKAHRFHVQDSIYSSPLTAQTRMIILLLLLIIKKKKKLIVIVIHKRSHSSRMSFTERRHCPVADATTTPLRMSYNPLWKSPMPSC